MLDGVQIIAEEKAKSENLHGVDLTDRDQIFKSILPQENFVDRRIADFNEIEDESEDDIKYEDGAKAKDELLRNSTDNESTARQYVGELFSRLAGQ